MKTYEAPLKAQWGRAEYLSDKKDMAALEGRPFTPFIFCHHCRREIKDSMINVVAFGKQVVCKSCYSKKWEKIKNRIGKFAVPQALEDSFEDQPDSEEFLKQKEQDKKEVLDMQLAEMERIKTAGKEPGR